MDFQNTLFSMPLLTGLIFIITGFIVLKYPPKNSMKSQQLWNFAQIYSSKLMIYAGLSLAISSIFGLLLSVTAVMGVIISTILIILLTITLFLKTENKLKQILNTKK